MFALPLIYTMEMWWLGYDMPTLTAIAWLGLTFVFAAGLNQLSGYREAHGLAADLGDATVALALGLCIAAAVLAALGEIDGDTSAIVAVRQVIWLAMPVSIGISLSRSLLSAEQDEDDPAEISLAQRIGVAAAGAVLLGMSAAPTEEIRMIASRIAWPHLLGMSLLTALLTWAAVSSGGKPRGVGEIVLVSAIGLATASVLVLALGFLRGGDGPTHLLAVTVTLGVPATLGAALGRLVL